MHQSRQSLRFGARVIRAMAVALSALLWLNFLAGCDDKPAVVPQAVNTTPKETPRLDGRPTSRALLEGPRNKLQLGIIPLTVKVPASWSVQALDRSIFLQGPLPIGEADIHISLSIQPRVSDDRMKNLISGAQAKAAQSGGTVVMIGPRTTGKVTFLEEQETMTIHGDSASTSRPVQNALGAALSIHPATTQPDSQIMNWSVWAFIRRTSGGSDRYLLSFSGLEQPDYDSNRKFLREIVDSLEFDEHAGEIDVMPH